MLVALTVSVAAATACFGARGKAKAHKAMAMLTTVRTCSVVCQCRFSIIAWVTGMKINCPTEPPAVTMPP